MTGWPRDAYVAAVWESDLKPLARLVAFCYADHAGSGDVAWVTFPRLRERTGLSTDAANRALRQLEAAGWLVCVERARQHRAARYRLVPVPGDNTASPPSPVVLAADPRDASPPSRGFSPPSRDASPPSPGFSPPSRGNDFSSTSRSTSLKDSSRARARAETFITEKTNANAEEAAAVYDRMLGSRTVRFPAAYLSRAFEKGDLTAVLGEVRSELNHAGWQQTVNGGATLAGLEDVFRGLAGTMSEGAGPGPEGTP